MHHSSQQRNSEEWPWVQTLSPKDSASPCCPALLCSTWSTCLCWDIGSLSLRSLLGNMTFVQQKLGVPHKVTPLGPVWGSWSPAGASNPTLLYTTVRFSPLQAGKAAVHILLVNKMVSGLGGSCSSRNKTATFLWLLWLASSTNIFHFNHYLFSWYPAEGQLNWPILPSSLSILSYSSADTFIQINREFF